MTGSNVRSSPTEYRRRFHEYPEPGWCEFYTTSEIVDAVREIGVDALSIGRDIHEETHRMAVPSAEKLERWQDTAVRNGANEDVLEATAGGFTGAIAELRRGAGPVVALRVDIDGLHVSESVDDGHVPSRDGFRSANDGVMHACGHDGHIAIGLGVLETIKNSDFDGVFRVIFQPAEEVAGGGKSIAASGHLDDVDSLFCQHLGLGNPSGTVIGGIVKPLAVSNFDIHLSGDASHAANEPETGNNCLQAAATILHELYAIPRHSDGMTRINVGRVDGGTARNIVADQVCLECEVRGETNELEQSLMERVRRIVENGAEMHGCTADIKIVSDAPRVDSDPALSRTIASLAREHVAVDTAVQSTQFGASEDATHLMQAVTENGGNAVYSIFGTDHPGGHHTSTFDIDETSLTVAIDVLSDAILSVET